MRQHRPLMPSTDDNEYCPVAVSDLIRLFLQVERIEFTILSLLEPISCERISEVRERLAQDQRMRDGCANTKSFL